MRGFTPPTAPAETAFDRDLVQKIRQGAFKSEPYDQLDWRHSPPDKAQKGMRVLADGTDWDPGSGRGEYVRNEDNDAWLFLGPLTTAPSTTGSFTATGTGFLVAPTATWYYSIVGGVVHLTVNPMVGTSNAASYTITGIPSEIQPASQRDFVLRIQDNSNYAFGIGQLSGGTLTLSPSAVGATAGWTAANFKGIQRATLTYRLAD